MCPAIVLSRYALLWKLPEGTEQGRAGLLGQGETVVFPQPAQAGRSTSACDTTGKHTVKENTAFPYCFVAANGMVIGFGIFWGKWGGQHWVTSLGIDDCGGKGVASVPSVITP